METKPNSRFRGEKERGAHTRTDPFFIINALHSLNSCLTWQIEKEHIIFSLTEMACRSGLRGGRRWNFIGPCGEKQVIAANRLALKEFSK